MFNKHTKNCIIKYDHLSWKGVGIEINREYISFRHLVIFRNIVLASMFFLRNLINLFIGRLSYF